MLIYQELKLLVLNEGCQSRSGCLELEKEVNVVTALPQLSLHLPVQSEGKEEVEQGNKLKSQISSETSSEEISGSIGLGRVQK